MGDGPNSDIEPCGKADCHLCSILKEGFDLKYAKTSGMFGPGIYSTTCSSSTSFFRVVVGLTLTKGKQRPTSTPRTTTFARTGASFSFAGWWGTGRRC